VLERLFVEQRVGDARPKQRDPAPADADDLLDQVEPARSSPPRMPAPRQAALISRILYFSEPRGVGTSTVSPFL
jgi:hypothetical protein